MTTPDVFAVVVSYNNSQYTTRAVRHLEAQTVPVRTLIWDNNSPDGSGNVLARAGFGPNTELVRSPDNLLWSPAINAAMRDHWQDESYLVWLNNDIMLPPDAIEKLIQVLENTPGAGMVGPMGSRIGGPQDYATHMHAWVAEGKGTEAEFKARSPFRAPFLIGCCTLMPYRVFRKIGYLNKDMPLGADDHDYSIRMKHAGYTIWVHPGVYVDHIGHASGASPNWNEWGGKSWDAFNTLWDGYFATEEEALKCHWGHEYHPGWERGTGWSEEKYKERIINGNR